VSRKRFPSITTGNNKLVSKQQQTAVEQLQHNAALPITAISKIRQSSKEVTLMQKPEAMTQKEIIPSGGPNNGPKKVWLDHRLQNWMCILVCCGIMSGILMIP
jgi:hypothetical protein